MIPFTLALIAFLLTWLFLMLLRAKVRRLVLHPVDLLIALIPIALYVLFSGQLRELTAGDYRTLNAIHFATQARVEGSALKAPRFDEMVPFQSGIALKEARALNRLVAAYPDGLTFKFGEFYDGPVVQQSITRLLAQPQFHYLVVVDDEERFIALGNARTMLLDYDTFSAKVLRHERLYLASQGFQMGGAAITTTDTRVQALEKMTALKEEIAPVIDTRNFFQGIKSRAQLSAEVVVDLASVLKQN